MTRSGRRTFEFTAWTLSTLWGSFLISYAANLPVQGEVKSAAGRWLDAAALAFAGSASIPASAAARCIAG